MTDDSLLNQWFDKWEELRAGGQEVRLEEFIAVHCREAPPPLLDQFRRDLSALHSMDRQLGVAEAGTDTTGEMGHKDSTGPHARPGTAVTPGTDPVTGYQLEVLLGRGGFGEVWRARKPDGFLVALKFVRLEGKIGAAELRALDLARQIRHAHLLPVFGTRQSEHTLIIEMELADGTLYDRLRQVAATGACGIPRDELLEYMAEAAKALDFLSQARHALGGKASVSIQHRDIKPHNLLLVGGSVKLGDFGLARWLEQNGASHSGSLTVSYAAPEFFEGRMYNQSDQYSLAVTYCELRGGRLPFTGTQAQVMAGHLRGEPDLSMVPEEERPAVARALARQPEKRWPTCREFVETLRQARPKPTPPPRRRTALLKRAGDAGRGVKSGLARVGSGLGAGVGALWRRTGGAIWRGLGRVPLRRTQPAEEAPVPPEQVAGMGRVDQAAAPLIVPEQVAGGSRVEHVQDRSIPPEHLAPAARGRYRWSSTLFTLAWKCLSIVLALVLLLLGFLFALSLFRGKPKSPGSTEIRPGSVVVTRVEAPIGTLCATAAGPSGTDV